MSYSRPVERTPSSRDEEETLGDGQFDRFSSARRTRRYRKSQDGDDKSDANDEKQIRPTSLKVKPHETLPVEPKVEEAPKKEAVIKNKIPVLQSSYLRNSRLSATLPHSFKSKLDDKPTFKSRLPTKENFIPEIKVRALTPTKGKMEHDHDEGFEETQSLISDSPSQTTSSGYNYDIDNMDSPSPSTLISSSDSKQILFSRTDSSGSGDAEVKIETKKASDKVSLLPKRTSSLKLQSKTIANDESSKVARSVSMNRTKNEVPNDSSKRFVVKSKLGPAKTTEIKRSPSKSSLKSSRSSLNSCASISTVKTVKPNPNNYKNVIKTLASNLQKSANKSPTAKIVKKPLAPSQIRHPANTIVPSRSNSSVGAEQPRKVSLNLSTSFKENSSDQMNKLMHSSSQNFMKPTASSSAKDTTEIKPKLVVRAPFK